MSNAKFAICDVPPSFWSQTTDRPSPNAHSAEEWEQLMVEARTAIARPFRGRGPRGEREPSALNIACAALAGEALRPHFERNAERLIGRHFHLPIVERAPQEVLARDGKPAWGRIIGHDDAPVRVEVCAGLPPRKRNIVLAHEAGHLLGWASEVEAEAFGRSFTDSLDDE